MLQWDSILGFVALFAKVSEATFVVTYVLSCICKVKSA